MDELSEEQCEHVTPRSKGSSLLIDLGFARDPGNQELRNEGANFTGDSSNFAPKAEYARNVLANTWYEAQTLPHRQQKQNGYEKSVWHTRKIIRMLTRRRLERFASP